MSKPTRADLQLAFQLERERGQHALEELGRRLQTEIGLERSARVAAQRGLVPYVRSLEAFNGWIKARPRLAKELRPILTELGLWDIKLGYDPDQDLALSIISPKRHSNPGAKK